MRAQGVSKLVHNASSQDFRTTINLPADWKVKRCVREFRKNPQPACASATEDENGIGAGWRKELDLERAPEATVRRAVQRLQRLRYRVTPQAA